MVHRYSWHTTATSDVDNTVLSGQAQADMALSRLVGLQHTQTFPFK